MRIITKFMLACVVAGSAASLTSCKDYSEEDGNELRVNLQDQKKAMEDLQQQISDLTAKLQAINSCNCNPVSITKNADGTYTIKQGDTEVKVGDVGSNTDANGRTYVIAANGDKIYIPTIEEENGKKYIVIGNQRYELCDPCTPYSPTHTVTIDDDKITITDANDPTKKWEFDKSTTGGASCACTVSYNKDKGVFEVKDGENTIEVKPGNVATFTDNGETITLTVGEGTTAQTTTFKKVQSEVRTAKNENGEDVIYIQYYNNDGSKKGDEVSVVIPKSQTVDLTPIENKITNILNELYGENGTKENPVAGSVIDRLNNGENIIKDIYGENGNAENPEATSIAGRLNTVEETINDLVTRVGKLEDARAKQVTGIIVQQVANPAFGSYNSVMTNLQTNMLVAYYGVATKAINFPNNDDNSVEPIEKPANAVLMNGKAGQLYVTINPNTVDFDGMDGLKLVNSQDEECAVKLGTIQKTDDVLHFGASAPTRATGNGFYTVSATIDQAGLADPNVHLNIDKSKIKTALKDLVSVRDKSGAKIALQDFAKVAVDVAQAMQLDAQGVKCAWTDMYGEHAVYSNYNIAALAVSPLGFNTVDGVFADGGKYWQAYNKGKELISKASKKLGQKISNQINKQFMLDKIGDDILDIQSKFNHVNEIKPLEGKIVMDANVTIPAFDVTVGPFTQNVTVNVPGQTVSTGDFNTTVTVSYEVPDRYNPEDNTFTEKTVTKVVPVTIPSKDIPVGATQVTVPVTIAAQTVTIPEQNVTVTVDITDQVNGIFNSMLGDINQNFKDVNDLIDALNLALNDVNEMLSNIRNLQQKLESNGVLPQRVFAYLDKVAAKVAQYTPELFKPTLLISSDNGLGVCGFYGAPSEVKGNVTIVPTTWTGELLSPIYKKYIRINNGNGQYVEGNSLDITSQLKSGVNTIEYRALDYQGVEWVGYYQVVR